MHTPSVNEVLARNLRHYMEERNLTQEAVAKMSGLAQTTISLYLSPDNRDPTQSGRIASPRLADVEKLAKSMPVQTWLLLCPLPEEDIDAIPLINKLVSKKKEK